MTNNPPLIKTPGCPLARGFLVGEVQAELPSPGQEKLQRWIDGWWAKQPTLLPPSGPCNAPKHRLPPVASRGDAESTNQEASPMDDTPPRYWPEAR